MTPLLDAVLRLATPVAHALPELVGRFALGHSGANASHFSWFQMLPGISGAGNIGEKLGLNDAHEAVFIPTTWAIVLGILAVAGVARLGLNSALARAGTDKYLADTGLTVRNVFEMMVEFLNNLMIQSLGQKETRAFFPLVGGLFVYILFANLSGFIPGVRPPTDNLSSNFAMAITVFLVFNYAGLSRNGFGYIKHLGGPVVWLAPVFFILESISLIIRPMSLSMRLTVNIFVDHLLQGIARTLGDGSIVAPLMAATLPVPLYFLGLLVCTVQAFVFALLTIIYVSQATAHEDHGTGHAH
ncbi:MAG: ATP synthase F0 subunit A [Myxococcales bacterium]|nr:ATP synthase F0 subunit A [Myxococcales bacterium]